MKFSILILLTFPLISIAADTTQVSCRFSGGKIIKGDTGEVVMTTLNPRVLPTATKLTVEKSSSDIWITSMSDFDISLLGYPCHADDGREGFDCYYVTPNSGRQFKAFSSSNGQKRLGLVLPLGVPGNLFQEDTYSCNH